MKNAPTTASETTELQDPGPVIPSQSADWLGMTNFASGAAVVSFAVV